MGNQHKIDITNRDRLLFAWNASMELTRDFEHYADECFDDEMLAEIFHEFSRQEALHAAKFKELLHQYEQG